MCYDRLEDMLKLVSSTVVKKESKFVVQKYIGKHDITTVSNNKMYLPFLVCLKKSWLG